jgi:hypothetical protein
MTRAQELLAEIRDDLRELNHRGPPAAEVGRRHRRR